MARVRERQDHETEFSRIVAFTDGVLAIAITLLVLSLEVPRLSGAEVGELPGEIVALWPQLLAYALSFAVIGRFWLIHHRFFGGLARFDDRLVTRNLLYLGLVVLVPFTTELLGSYGDQPAAAIAYAVVLGCAAVASWSLIRHSLSNDLLRPDARAETERYGTRRALAVPGIFFVSIPIALLSPLVAELMWLAILVGRSAIWGARG